MFKVNSIRVFLIVMIAVGVINCDDDEVLNPIPDPQKFDASKFDFIPQRGDGYNIKWVTGTPPVKIGYAKMYRLELTLVHPAPYAQMFKLKVMADSIFIGEIEASFNAGNKTPSILYKANAGAKYTPDGATDLRNGLFWMVCTSGSYGLVRGNVGKSKRRVTVQITGLRGNNSTSHGVDCF